MLRSDTVRVRNKIVLGLLLGLLFFLFGQSLDDPFFWDGVQLGAKQAWFYFDHNFQYFWLPQEIDSGHPPFFGLYLAGCWKIFGANLGVSHLATLPFLVGFVYAAWQLGRHYLGPESGPALLLIYMADPTVLSQLLLIGPDLALMCFFLLAFLGYSQNRKLLQMLSVLGLAVISMRGMMCAFALFLFEYRSHLRTKSGLWKWWWQEVKIYSPGVLLALWFLILHLRGKGWIGYHPESPWAPSFQKNTFAGAGWNLLILGWRMLDFGRIVQWLAFLALLIKQPKLQKWPPNTILALFLFFVLAWPFILYVGLNQHRYLIPFYLILHLVFLQQLQQTPWSTWKKKILFGLVVSGLLTGQLWIYPSGIAQGWDSSLAHRPYFSLRTETEDFLNKRAIPLDSVGADFPAIGPLRNFDPTVSGIGFANKNEKLYDYYFISNIMNGFTVEDLNTITQNYHLIFHRQKRGVYVSIYEKKEKKSDGAQ